MSPPRAEKLTENREGTEQLGSHGGHRLRVSEFRTSRTRGETSKKTGRRDGDDPRHLSERMSAAPPPGPAATAMFTQHTTCTSGRLSSPKKNQNRHPRAAIRAQTRGRKPNAKVRPPAVVATTSDPSAHSLSSLVTCPAANCRGKRETPGVRHKSTSSVSAAQVLVEFHRLFAGFAADERNDSATRNGVHTEN